MIKPTLNNVISIKLYLLYVLHIFGNLFNY